TIDGEVDRKGSARERFEEAIVSGHTAALLEEETSSLFTQELGNIPPGATITARITLDQRLAWLDGTSPASSLVRDSQGSPERGPHPGEGSWEWRFPLAAAPRYLGEPG